MSQGVNYCVVETATGRIVGSGFCQPGQANVLDPATQEIVKKAMGELTKVFEELEKKAATPQANVFAEITDADIDNLFND